MFKADIRVSSVRVTMMLTVEARPPLFRRPRRSAHHGGVDAHSKVGMITPITKYLKLHLGFLCLGHGHLYVLTESHLSATALLPQGSEDCSTSSVLESPGMQDVLPFINAKGPGTEGIFRKWADMEACRVLQEKLNSGDKVNLDSESVLVVACVLKISFEISPEA
uniref:Rho-GAP domain-containing protein n=1 Tax=Molossus molossus TaxID=27622 RepID=A0A7J8I1Y0_MOLMO|nr:hypothetical protein HJG59_010854 [Molossus molossus]